MCTIARPLDPDAVKAADDRLYANHTGDPRPNALFDADGNRIKLDPNDPDQAALREEWKELYLAARKDPPPDLPAENRTLDPVQRCPDRDHWIEIRLIDAQKKPVSGAKYHVVLPDGSPREGSLDDDGRARFESILAGTCTVAFPEIDSPEWRKHHQE